MRKAKIEIFTVFTVILFLLSTGTSVTATLHEDYYMILNSIVDDEGARVNADPQNVGGEYSNWSWIIDINDGDDIIIHTTCNFYNYYPPSYPGEGYHYFHVMATYVNGLDIRGDDDDDDFTTYDTGDSGSVPITVSFTDVDEGGEINMYWYVQAINKKLNVDDDFGHPGTIYLT